MSEYSLGHVARLWLGSQIRSWISNWPASEWPSIFGYGRATSAGVPVSEYTALNYSAFWSAVCTVSGDVASLPLILYKRTANGGKERYLDSKLYELLHDAPNPEMTAMVFREALQGHAMTWGNAYAEIERDGLLKPVALWPITPDRVTPFREERTKALLYRVTNSSGGQAILPPSRMLHVPGLGYDGVTGYSVISQARESIALGLATERFGGEFFGNGTTFGGVLTSEKPLTKEVKESIRESIDAIHTGVDRAHRFGIFGHGFKFEKTGIPPNDAQFLETRRFQITEIARWFQIPPHKLGDLERATFSNIEQQDIEYYRSCLRRWLVRWEQEINRKLIAPLERKQQFFKHNVEGFLRGDSTARAAFYTAMFNVGAFSINNILELEDMNPIGDEGNVHFVQGNLLPADLAMEGPKEPTTVTVEPQKQLPAGDVEEEDEDKRALRALLSEIAGNTAALQTSMAAEREVMSQAERDQHQQTVTRLESERIGLQRALDEYREQQVERTTRLDAARETAEAAAQTEQARRAAAEADAEAAKAERDRIHLEAEHRARDDRAAREAAEAKAVGEAQSRAVAEQQAQTATTSWLEADKAAADALAERDRLQAERDRIQAEADQRSHDDRAARDAAEAKVLAEVEARTAAETQAQVAEHDAQIARSERDRLTEEREQAAAAFRAALATANDQLAGATARVEAMEARAFQLAEESRGLAVETETMRTAREQAEKDVVEARAQATAAHVKTVDLEQAIQARKAAELDRLTRVVAAHRALIADTVRRLMVPELDRARRRQSTPDSLRKWAEAFYVTHPDVCAEALYPAVFTHLAWKGSPDDPRQAARALAVEHCEESKRQVLGVIDGSTSEVFHADLERLLQRWEQERPDLVADKVLKDEIEYLAAFN